MAEIAAGAVVAEEVVSTTVQGAVATYAIAKPTNGLKGSFRQIAVARDEGTRYDSYGFWMLWSGSFACFP